MSENARNFLTKAGIFPWQPARRARYCLAMGDFGLNGSMRKFLRRALIVCLAIAAVPAALFVSLWFWISYKTAEVDGFYRENRLLGEMRAVEKESTNDSAAAREALLKTVPVGTSKEDAVAVLRREKLACPGVAGPIACQTMSPNVLGYKQWIITLDFDTDEHLSEVRVAIWNIFL